MKNIFKTAAIFLTILPFAAFAAGDITTLKISLPEAQVRINPHIYGQMFEDCNDKIIYGGLLRADGSLHPEVEKLLKPLQIPVMRWPAGTYIHEYDWKKGIGPMAGRPKLECFTWGGVETNQFGTDEFLKWCEVMGVEPYINFNMGNDAEVGGSLGEALDWLEYANGDLGTKWGKRRAKNGHEAPYNVRYWCIGNENYLPVKMHAKENAEVYAKNFNRWASAIRAVYPDIILLGVGHTFDWNRYVLENCGRYIDILTLHFYVHAKIKDAVLENPENILFAPEKIEANIAGTAAIVKSVNAKFGRASNPITICIDEWTTRHQLFDGQKYSFTDRRDARRLFDVPIVAGMLNVFIRQSPAVSMANYIFPVNGHGLINTNGDDDAYKTAIYPVFEVYRKTMRGTLAEVSTEGPRTSADVSKFSIGGSMNKVKEISGKKMTLIDSAAVKNDDGRINLAIVNRSHNAAQTVRVEAPAGYAAAKIFEISGADIYDANTPADRDKISLKERNAQADETEFTLNPCAVFIVQFQKK